MKPYSVTYLLVRESALVGGHLSMGLVTFYLHTRDLRDEMAFWEETFSEAGLVGSDHRVHTRAQVIIETESRNAAILLGREEIARACDAVNTFLGMPGGQFRLSEYGFTRCLESGLLEDASRHWRWGTILRGNMPNQFPVSVIRELLASGPKTNALGRAAVDAVSWLSQTRAIEIDISRLLCLWIALETVTKIGTDSFQPFAKISLMLGLDRGSRDQRTRLWRRRVEQFIEDIRRVRDAVVHSGYRALSLAEDSSFIEIEEIQKGCVFLADVVYWAIEYCCVAHWLGAETLSEAWEASKVVLEAWPVPPEQRLRRKPPVNPI